MMFWYDNGTGGWGYVLMSIGMVLFWGLIIAGIVALVRYAGRGQGDVRVPSQRTPQDLLAERFARGEIDEQEFQHRSDLLRGGGGHAEAPGGR